MSITLIGGMDRLKPEYQAVARENDCNLKFISRNECNFMDKIGHPDKLIVFTNKISHEAKRKAKCIAQAKGIPVQFVHSCGVSTLKACLK